MWASNHGLSPGEEDAPSYFICPITYQVMNDPVLVLESGHTYERMAIQRWFGAGNRTDPKTNQKLTTTAFGPNLALRGLIDEWRISLVCANNIIKANDTTTGNISPESSPTAVNKRVPLLRRCSLARQQRDMAAVPEPPLQDSRVSLLIEFANDGKPWAQAEMGILYRRGLGVPQDMVKAAEHFRKAAEQGDTGGIFHLGWCEYLGRGVARDLKRAVEHFTTASERNHARAQALLALCYRGGTGVAVDDVAARYWAELSAGQGDACGQAVLCMYRNDLGSAAGRQFVKVTRGKLARLIKEDPDSSLDYCIGMLYHLERDLAAAHEWFKKSAKQGYGLGQNAIGHQYRMGEVVMKSPGLAVEWFNKALEGGCTKAQKSLERMEE
eukprot:TRINITY_DN1098_c0_g1_i1.p1 TRINITY_DN1098_c0_g1~~TRINITY_DN1098_c0_g1_i1.p1  ORF type:complete len:383 (-),score=62.25 TRINITY_DN1098_c0_g1_i1:494-1642(-)